MKLFKKVDPAKRLSVSFNSFVKNPKSVLTEVLNWLGVETGDGAQAQTNNGELVIRPSDQHIYVGNRWLFANPENPVEFKMEDSFKNLTPAQRLIMRVILPCRAGGPISE